MRSTRELNDLMEIGHVIRVQDGVASDEGIDRTRREMWAPECIYYGFDGGKAHIEPGQGWTLLEGYTGQHGYSGPIMHSSEYVGGRLERDILARNGYYVALVCEVIDDPDWDYSVENPEPAGWAVAYRPLES